MAEAGWRLIRDDGVGAALGLAMDEALMARYHEPGADPRPTVRLYTYRSHCALVGRFQAVEAEVDLEACAETGTEVGRRLTGGGAIIMGEAQLGVAVVSRAVPGEPAGVALRRLSAGIIDGLAELGIGAGFRGKNDLEVAGRKIAGLGLYRDPGGALLFHASVLADLDVPFMLRVLRIPLAKLGGKAARAVEERVTTVRRELGGRWRGEDLREAVARGFGRLFSSRPRPEDAGPEERALADELVRSRYGTRAWVVGPRGARGAVASGALRTPAGLLRVDLSLRGGLLQALAFSGDFNERPPALARVEAALRWRRVDDEELDRLVARACDGETGLGVGPAAIADLVRAAARSGASRGAPARARGCCYLPEVG